MDILNTETQRQYNAARILKLCVSVPLCSDKENSNRFLTKSIYLLQYMSGNVWTIM